MDRKEHLQGCFIRGQDKKINDLVYSHISALPPVPTIFGFALWITHHSDIARRHGNDNHHQKRSFCIFISMSEEIFSNSSLKKFPFTQLWLELNPTIGLDKLRFICWS